MARDVTYKMKSTGEEITLHITDEMEPFVLSEGEEYMKLDLGKNPFPDLPGDAPCSVPHATIEELRKLF